MVLLGKLKNDIIEHVFVLEDKIVGSSALLDRNNLRDLEEVFGNIFLLSTHIKGLLLLSLKYIHWLAVKT
jgi:hypothetical protein